jgi:hypothetical protein
MSILVESAKGIYGLHNLYSTEDGREIRGRVLQLINMESIRKFVPFDMSDWRTCHHISVSSFPIHSLNLWGQALSFSSSYVLLRESGKCALQSYKCGPMGEQDIRNSSRKREIR